MNNRQKKVLFRILFATAVTALLHFLPVTGLWRLGLYMIPYLIAGYDILWKAVQGIWNKQIFDEDFLMAIATVGALVLGVTYTGDYLEAVAVMLLYQTGELFQSIAVGKSRKNIGALMDIRPDYANIPEGNTLRRVDPEEVEVGSIIVVQPGEKIPLDGLVTEGCSTLNTAPLTGESMPRDVAPGDSCISGCINLTGVLQIRTTKLFSQSTASKILELVENAGARKTQQEKFISKFARVYTPAVCAAALALAVLPPVVSLLLGNAPLWNQWLYRALSFLVASCPCALVISIPLTFFAGLGGASRAGILIKGSNYLEALSKTGTVVFDKTGTLTRGEFQVCRIHSVSLPEEKLLYYAAHVEAASSHPIAKSLVAAYSGTIDRSRVSQLSETGGSGITARVDDAQVSIGNAGLMDTLGITYTVPEEAGTVIYIAIDSTWAGYFVIRDMIKESAPDGIAGLKALGISQTVMLTGDSSETALQVAKALGISSVYSQLLPADKVDRVELLMAQKGIKDTLIFVGDGINDAPVLARADVGFAMGALGSDAAIEAADVVLMDDDPVKVAKAIRIAKKCMSIATQNIVGSIAVKIAALALVALGVAGMWLAVFADVGVMVLAVLNAIRALYN